MAFPESLPASSLGYRLAKTFIVATTPAHIVVTILLVSRIVTRVRPVWRLSIDDYLICLAYALATVMFGFLTAGESSVVAQNRRPFLDTIEYAMKMGSLALPFWGWSIGIVKISIAFMLLRFQQSRGWRIFLYILILLNAMLIGFSGIAGLFQCVPYRANWDIKGLIKNKRCWGQTMQHVCLYSTAGLNISTDIIFSLIPLTFLRKLRRPRREKIVIAVLMALGLVASAMSITRLIFAAKISLMGDAMAWYTMAGLLMCLEVQAGIMAACIPPLRSSSKRLLQNVGILSRTKTGTMSGYPDSSSGSEGPRDRTTFVNLEQRHTVYSMEMGSPTEQESGGHDGHRGNFSRGVEDEEEDGVVYVMDPKTGRIIPTPPD